MKNFDYWNDLKKLVDMKNINLEFHEREIWWASFGLNIGSEQNGIGESFERPVVIIKKLSPNTFLCAPLSTKKKLDKFQSEINSNKKGFALLDQVRVLDFKRLLRKIGTADEKEFSILRVKFSKLYI
jgi:mRNA-degrading endonuclease toxin of MazEF toxin-antitoxin module